VDGANGVGALKAKVLGKYIAEYLKIDIYNDGSDGILNKGVFIFITIIIIAIQQYFLNLLVHSLKDLKNSSFLVWS